jgi:protein-tyrosine phosphatase
MLATMVDIHCHILPGLDDGAESLEQSLEMAEMAIADGITHVVATPHANGEYPYDPDTIRQRRDELQQRLGDRLCLLTGCDFHLSFENIQDLRTNPAKYTLNQKNYLLVEFADFAIPPNADETLHQLQLLGLCPIITHPERNRLIRARPEQLRKWLHQGCYVQVTAQSLLGGFGESTQKQVEEWLDREMVHFFASDAHNPGRRPLRLRAAYEAVAEKRGEERARALFRENPLAAVEGRPLAYEPEPPEVAARPAHAGRRKRFFFF